ncbi:MAG: recombinase family protein [Thermincola ferriacetica]
MKLIRAAAYCRYSSDNQREESITAQLRAIEEYCKQKGYCIVRVYKDEEKTATTDRRPEFQQMISDSALGVFDVVVVHKLDRFARNRYDSAFYKRKLKLNGVVLESVLEPLDNSPEAVILESVLEGMAEYYSKNLAREVRKGLLENAEKGLHNGGRPPYGLKVNPETRRYEIDYPRNQAVLMYFEGIDQDIPLSVIAERINQAGFRTYNGRKFTKNSFDGWAYNRKYKGDYTWDVAAPKREDGKRNTHAKKPKEQQIIIPGAIPQIVPDDLWERVNAKMKNRQRTGGRMKAKIVYLLSGKVFCGKCGRPYTGESYRSRKNFYSYYKCSGKCGNRNVKKDTLEEIVINQLIDTCFTSEAMAEIAKRVKELYAERHSKINDEIQTIKKEIETLENKINNWVDAIGEGILDKSTVAGKIREATEKKEFLLAQLAKAEVIEATREIKESDIIKFMENKKHLLFSENEEEKKQVIQEYVESVTVLHSKDGLEVNLTVRFFNGGGEGSRTPVRKRTHTSFSERSLVI